MSQMVLWEIGILSLLLWGISVGFVVFSWILLRRQQKVFLHIAARLERLDEALLGQKAHQAKKARVSIPKDELISKYESVSLPDDVEISFIEKEDSK